MSLTTGNWITASQTLEFESRTPTIEAAVWTNLGPLTTTFSPPASCSPFPPGGIIVDDYSDTDKDLVQYSDCNVLNFKPPQWLDCQPSGPAFAPYWYATSTTIQNSYYSPGVYCPSGYTSADVFVLATANVSAAKIQPDALRATGTHVFCCPRYSMISLSRQRVSDASQGIF